MASVVLGILGLHCCRLRPVVDFLSVDRFLFGAYFEMVVQLSLDARNSTLVLIHRRTECKELKVAVAGQSRLVFTARWWIHKRRRTAHSFDLVFFALVVMSGTVLAILFVVVLLATEGVARDTGPGVSEQGSLRFINANLSLRLETLPAI